MTQPVVTIFNKPVSDNSGVFESNKHILSEGRADLIGKRFTFENGNIRNKANELAFHSVTIAQKPIFETLLEEKKKNVDGNCQKQNILNHMEYNLSQSMVEPFPKNVDPKKPLLKLVSENEDNGGHSVYKMDTLFNKPTEDDIGNVKLKLSN